ncbi:M56 family metallopeptidase [Gimesia aquarii]|uniref:Methicillin resistance mecR1 protein n=1 Tax=Gimesia aquarii TaxID=2527964 RepID=A0A517WYT0_9PLAN|nr:M56 family metallopeptidase [Gimesia aquarii]QDU10410.1 Methicillin resistance mecR1 protein [Gimesia aquarii]
MNTFLNLVASNTIVAALLFGVLMLLRRRIKNPAVYHVILTLILVKLITPTYWQPRFDLLPSGRVATSVVRKQEVSSETNTTNKVLPKLKSISQNNYPRIPQVTLKSPHTQAPTSAASTSVDLSINKFDTGSEEAGRAWFARLTTDSEIRPVALIGLITIVWIIGIIGWCLLAIWRIVRFQWFLRQAQPASDNLNQMAQVLAAQIGLKSVPRLQMVKGNLSPLLWFCFSRARIILPTDLIKQLDDAECETLLLHELVHYRRGDHWVRLIELLATGIYWWNPILWLVRREIRVTEEQCCDAWVIQTLPEKRRSYAEVLVKAISYVSQSSQITGATGIGSANILEQRLKRIMCESLNGVISRRAKFVVAVIAVALLPFAPTLGEPLTQTNATENNDALPTPEDILSAYHDNFKKLMPIEIKYKVLTSESEACFNEDRRSLKDAKFMLTLNRTDLKVDGKIMYNEEMFQMLMHDTMERVERLNQALKPDNIKKRMAERIIENGYFWSDGKSFHRRWPKQMTDKEVELDPVPVVPPENLKTHYHSMNLAAWSKDNQPPMRCWFGGGNNQAVGQGIIGNNFNKAASLKTIAPLGQVKLVWNEPFDLHNLDAFMSKYSSSYRVVGRADLQGRPTILVDGYLTPPGKTGVRERIRAWVDPNQGYLPLRMEWAYIDVDGNVTNGIHRHIEVLEVQQIAEAHYPMRIKLQEYVYDTRVIEKQHQEIQKGKPAEELSPTPMIPGRTKIWEVTEFTPNKVIEAATMALKFPQNTPYKNNIDGRQYISGHSEPLPLPKKSIQVGEFAPPLQVASWLDGQSRNLIDFRGKVVFLLFIDISGLSNPLDDEERQQVDSMMKYLRKFHAKYSAKGVVFLEIHPAGTNPDQIRAYQKDRQCETLAAIDSGTKFEDSLTGKQYNGTNIELGLFLIGRNGRIAFNQDALEGGAGMNYYRYAARNLSIPLTFGSDVSEEEAMRRGMQILEFMISEQIDKALSVKF